MPLDDAFGSGKEQLRQSLLEQYQPDDGQPFSVEPKILTDRLARKLAIRPSRDENVDFNVAPEKPKEKGPDLSEYGTPVKDEAASTGDLSSFGTPVEPEGPPQPPLTIARQGAAALKGIPHGAIHTAGGVLKGAGALYDNGIPEQPETPQYDAMGNPTGMVNAPAAAVPAKPLQDRTLYKAGQATQDFAQTVAPMSDQEKESIGGRVGTGIGGIAAYGAATLAAGPLVGLTAAASGMALDTYGSVFEAAKAAGKTDEEASATAGKSALVAGVLGSLPLGAGKYAQSLIAKVAVSSAAFTTLGEAQEAILQEIAKDYDPKAGYTLDQKRIIAELILGAGMGGLHHAFERKPGEPQPDQPQPQPGAQPGNSTGLPPGAGGPQPGPGPQPGAGPRPGADPNAGAGPQPGGAGPNPGNGGPGNATGSAGNASGNARAKPGAPPPGTGEGKAGEAGYTMDPKMRSKMEDILRRFDPNADYRSMSDGELFDAVNEHMRDTSSTGHTAKPETPEEAAAREGTARRRDEDTELKGAFSWMTDAQIGAMTPELREVWLGRARGPKPGEQTKERSNGARGQNNAGSPRTDENAGVSDLAKRAGSVPESEQPGGSQLQPTRNRDGSGMGQLPDVSRGGGTEAEPGAYAGADQQRRGVRSGERSLGDEARASQQSAQERESDGAGANSVDRGVGARSGADAVDHPLSDQSGRDVARGSGPDAEAQRQASSGTRDKPIRVESPDHIQSALDSLPEEPKSQAQADAENYRHTHIELPSLGLVGKHSISVETGAGQTRRGVDPDGKPWEVKLQYPYGRIKGTVGADGQPLDVHLGPGGDIFVIDQHDPKTGKWDEHKLMIGFPDQQAAVRAYNSGFTDGGHNRIGHVVAMTPEQFQGWLKTDTTKPLRSAEGSKGHHTPEPSLEGPVGHHTPEPPSGAQADATGGSPSQPVPSPGRTKGLTGDSVNPENDAARVGNRTDAGSEKVYRAAAPKRKGRPGSTEPQNLLQFLASKGGLKPHPELEVMDAHKHVVAMSGFPPRRKLVRDTGMDLDTGREAAEEAGYFRGSHDGTATPAEFLDHIDNGVNRQQHLYAEGEQDHKTKAQQAAEDERDEHERQQAQELLDIIERAGGTETAPEIKARALELMRTTDLSGPEAIETAAMQLVSEEKDVQAEFYDYYGHEVDDEIYAQAASGYGENLAREGSSGDGHEEAAPSQSRVDHASAGEQGQRGRDDAGRAEPDAKVEQPDAGRGAARAGDESGAKNPREAERSDEPNLAAAKALIVEQREASGNPRAEAKVREKLRALAAKTPPSDEKTVAALDIAATRLDMGDGRKKGLEFAPAEKPSFEQMLAEQAAKQAPARKLVEDAIASGKPKLVLEKGAKKLVFSAGFDGTPYRVTSFDEQGPVGHRDYGDGESDVRQIVGEVYHALRDGYEARGQQPTTETGADNKPQTVLPGAEKASDKTMAQRAAAAPLKPKVAQKAADDGLFGDGHKQADIFDALAKKPAPPKDAFDDIFDGAMDKLPDLNIDDVAKGLSGLFGKGLSEPEAPFVDEAKYQQALPFFRAGVKHFATGSADLPTMVNSLVQHLFAAGMDRDAIRAMKPYIRRFTDDVTAGRETINAPSRSDVLESDRGEPKAQDGVGKADVSPAPERTGQGAGKRGSAADAGDQRPAGSERVSQDHAPAVGANGNLELPAREPVDEGSDASAGHDQRSADGGEEGFSFDDGTTDEAIRNAQKDADLNARKERQRKAEGTAVKPGDIANIADTLPMLFPEQHDDVLKTEQRYTKPDGHGMLFTNGTGTGKTYSGLGVIKRFAMQGKKNTLVVAPSQGILMDWVKSAKDLGLDMRVLDDTMSNGGKGLTATTYANLGANRTLADRPWDLVVADEAHKLSSDQNGTRTEALATFRALTKHPDGLHDRARMVLRADYDKLDKLPDSQKAAAYAALQKKAEPLIEKWKAEARPKALMMSATPFAYHQSLDYANGYLFEYDKDRSGSRYNSGDGRDAFFMQHLGYRMRTNKLTKPDADVKSEVMERQLHEYLKKQGSLSGRALTVDKDYDRKFVLAHDAAGELIDRALNFLQEAEGGRYRPLHEAISKKFDYLARMRLLEAMKAQSAIPYIKQSLALGRKVVVFHDYNEGGGISPFAEPPPSQKVTSYVDGKYVEADLAQLHDDFVRQNPYVKDLNFAKYPAPIHALTAAFPDAMQYNGNVPNKKRNEYKRLFNDDNSGRDIIIVQSAAGEAGISLHDTTGKKQRVLLNLGMPVRPTTSIQQEGRIYRVGQASDAMFRYMNTGTDWERWTFAGKIAERAGTAENLALGDQARTIRQSFVDAFSNAGDYTPEPGEGKGGKEIDRATSHSVSEFDKAKTHYFAQQKVTGRRDQRDGVDYYATPEPIGLKMVEFAGLKPGEKILEPSAGHGAIARYFPEDSARTLVEPSSSLASRAALTSPGSRVVVDRFENLDKGANKFDAIVMNPPFGTGGKTAIEHLEKAAGHLKNGGRIVALIPRGSTDAKFDKFMDSPAAKGVYIVGDINLPSVTFERAGTSISARIVVLEKQTDPEVSQKLQQKSRDYSDVEKIGELFDRIENADMGQRLEPKTKDVDAPINGNITVGGVEFHLWNTGQNNSGKFAADIKNKLGKPLFAQTAKAAEANGGYYSRVLKSFEFTTADERQKFLDAVANPPAAPEAPSAPSGVTFKTGETIHAKTGAKLFVATANERVDGDVYSQMNAVAKANGGYYSSFKGRGAIPGFQFKSADDRQKFLDQMGGKPDGGPGPGLASVDTDNIMSRLVHDFVAPAPAKQERQLGQLAQQHVLTQGRETGNEHLVALDANGRIIDNASVENSHNRVALSPEFFDLLLDPNEDVVVHHNHPEGSSFSHDDLAIASLPGMRTVWAHGHDGSIYRAEVTQAGKAMLPAEWKARSKQMELLVNVIQNSIMSRIKPAFIEKRFSADEGNRALPHLVNVVLRDAGFIDYETNFDDTAFRAKIPGLDENIAKAAAIIRKQVSNERVHDRPARAVRHPGDVGAVFDRGAVARPVAESRRSDPNGGANHPREEKGSGPALASPEDIFHTDPNSFDNSIADILRTRLLGRLGHWNATEMRVQLQDKFIRVKKAEESVGAPSDLSTYQAESLYYGRTGQRLETLTEHHIDPLIREMKARDIDVEKLDEFLYARHAPERNNKLGQGYQPGDQFHDAMTDHDKVGASGMSTNEALGIIRAIRQAGKLPDYLAVAKMIDALNAKTRRTLFDGGLIDRDTFDALNAGYKYYVPLRGHTEGSEWMATGSGMNVRGKEFKTAFGRRSKASSPLAYSVMQAEMAVVRAEKNKVGNTFLQFVRANPDPTRWTIDRPPLVKKVDPTTGLVTAVPDNLYANRDNVFTTKVNGRDIHIALHGPDGLNLARALKNMGTANVHALIRTYSAVTHTMAKLATSWNPEFMIPNFARDIGEAFINLQAQEQKAFVRNFVKHIPGAMKGSMQALAGGGGKQPPGSPGRRYIDAFHEFDAAGGRIRFFGVDDPDQIESNVSRKLKRLEGGPVNTLKDIGDKAAKALEVAGGGIENATRLAAYMAARDAGFSIPDAAMLARNLTVDFNKKGELGGAIGSLYMFANAGIQGQARMARALGHRRVWQAVGALAAAAALSTLYSILASNTDETGIPEYMKIPTWERDKNLIFMIGNGGHYIKVPLPYGFSPFAVIGSHAVSVAMGHEKPGKAASAVMDSIISAFNPLGEESSLLMDLWPSALRPAAHIAFNKNWTDKPLYPEPDKNRGVRPDSTQSFKSNSAFSKETAKLLNEWSGGSAYKPGLIDVHPGSIDHILQAIGGGVGRFAKGIADSLYQNLSGGEWQPEKAPILRRFVGKVGPEADQALYYEKRQESLDEKAGINAARKDIKGGTNVDEAREFLASPANSRASIFKSADEQIKKLRAQKLDETELREKIRGVQNKARAQVQKLQPSP